MPPTHDDDPAEVPDFLPATAAPRMAKPVAARPAYSPAATLPTGTAGLTELRNALATLAGATLGPDYHPADAMRAGLPTAGTIYALALRETNERLVKCEQLIALGQRSEALRQASLDPDLLKRVTELDIPAWAAWADYAQRNGFPVPAALNKPAAAALNTAYAAERKLDDLLRQHRTLNLLRAPLRQRLDVLRLLAKAEPANPVWQDDVGKFEQARGAELLKLARKAGRERNWPLAEQLVEEARPTHWLTPLPLEVVDAVARTYEDLNRSEAKRGLEVLAGRLNDAVRARNLEDAEAVEKDILAVLKRFGVPETDALVDGSRPGFDWIAKENKRRKKEQTFDRAVHKLRQALRDAYEWAHVVDCYQAAMAYDLPLPEDVLEEYESRAKRVKLYRILWVAGGVAGVGLLVLVFLLLK